MPSEKRLECKIRVGIKSEVHTYCQRPQIGYHKVRRPTVSETASAPSTSDNCSGNQDASIYIHLETEDPGSIVLSTVKPLLQRGQLHQAQEALGIKAWRSEVTYFVS